MLAFIDCGLLAKEISMLFPDENNLTADINSAIKSLSMIVLGGDPTIARQQNFCKSLRTVVEQLYKLQHGEQDFELDEDSLDKVESLAQQAIDWKMHYNAQHKVSQSEAEPVGKKKKLDDSEPTERVVFVPTKPVPMDIKILICIHTLCWGTTVTAARFRDLYPDYQISKSGITMWVKRLPSLLEDSAQMAKRAIRQFDQSYPKDIPLRYIYECRQKLLHKRNILKYKITKLDIAPVLKSVLQNADLMGKFGHYVKDEEFCERLFHASSKINFEKSQGTTKEFFANHPKWFLE